MAPFSYGTGRPPNPRSQFRSAAKRGSTYTPNFKKGDHNPRKEWYPENWDELSAEIRKRDGYRCKSHKLLGGSPCKVFAPPPFSSVLHCHHIIPLPKGSNKRNNLITVCKDCHGLLHGKKLGAITNKQGRYVGSSKASRLK